MAYDIFDCVLASCTALSARMYFREQALQRREAQLRAEKSEAELRALKEILCLLDHAICAYQDGRRDGDTERFGGLQVYGELERRWLLNGKVCRFRTFQNLVDIGRRTPELIGQIRSISNKATGFGVLPKSVYHG